MYYSHVNCDVVVSVNHFSLIYEAKGFFTVSSVISDQNHNFVSNMFIFTD